MPEHLAVIKKAYMQAIVDGRKTVELRMARVAMRPYRCVHQGETIYFKESKGMVAARARVGSVDYYEQLTPTRIMALKDEHNRYILGGEEFWQPRLRCKYASLIHLTDVQPLEPFVPGLPVRSPWIVLKKGLLTYR